MEDNKINEIKPLFICKKCNSIPLIELVPKEPELKILLKCKCYHQQLIKQEIFFKYYYNNNHMDIETDNQEIKNEKIKSLIKTYEEYKNNYKKNLLKTKEEINKRLMELMKNIELLIDANQKYNDNIDKIIQIIIKNYKLNPDIDTNKENVIKNIQINSYLYDFNSFKKEFDFSVLTKKIKSNLKDYYLITGDKYQKYKSFQKEDFIIELDKNIFASVVKNELIKLFNINNIYDFIEIDTNITNDTLLIDEKKRYLISVEDNFFVKFRDLSQIINRFSDQNYMNKDISLSLLPLYEFKHDSLILNLINLENNLLAILDDTSINIYKYDVNKKHSEKIKALIIKADKYNLSKPFLKLIKRKENNFICNYNNSILNIYEIPTLIIKNEIKIPHQYNSKVIYEQINENELIIGDKNLLKIINIDNNSISFSKKINFEIMSIKLLKDNTILIGGRSELKRLYMKTLEELPCLISFDEDKYDYDYDDDYGGYFLTNINRHENDVLFINELSDGKIMLTLTYDIKIFGLDFSDI